MSLMKKKSLVMWNGNPQYTYNVHVKLLEKDMIYTIGSIEKMICGLDGAELEELPGQLFALSLLKEIQPPLDVNIDKLIQEPQFV